MTVSYETDKWGDYKIISKPNGTAVRILKKPSQAYIDKMAAKATAEESKQQVIDEALAVKKKIEDKKKDLAIQELLDKTEITQEELDKLEAYENG